MLRDLGSLDASAVKQSTKVPPALKADVPAVGMASIVV
jgi:hypothetical protein